MKPRVVFQAAEEAGQTSAAAKATNVQSPQMHPGDCSLLTRERAGRGPYNEFMLIPDAVRILERALQVIFGGRLKSLSAYGLRTHVSAATGDGHGHGGHAGPIHTLAVVDSLTVADLRACAAQTDSWHEAGLATPLLIGVGEFERSLDAFPLEFGAILADHLVAFGEGPFDKVSVDRVDIRRACEVQARSHLIHLREGFLETRGNAGGLAMLIVHSAAAFAALVASIVRLDGHAGNDRKLSGRHVENTLNLPAGAITDVTALVGVAEISSDEATRIFPSYFDAAQRLVSYADSWSAR